MADTNHSEATTDPLSPSTETVEAISEPRTDGPLILTLLLTNRNNNAENTAPQAIPDTLQVHPRTVALELETNDNPVLKLRGATDKRKRGQLAADQVRSWRTDGYLMLEDVHHKKQFLGWSAVLGRLRREP